VPLKRCGKNKHTAGTTSTAAASAASAVTAATLISTRMEPIPVFLHVADYIISFMSPSCYRKRAGSHVNLAKSKSRTGVQADTFDVFIFNIFKMKYLDEMDC
jgi:hypothetical protein